MGGRNRDLAIKCVPLVTNDSKGSLKTTGSERGRLLSKYAKEAHAFAGQIHSLSQHSTSQQSSSVSDVCALFPLLVLVLSLTGVGCCISVCSENVCFTDAVC